MFLFRPFVFCAVFTGIYGDLKFSVEVEVAGNSQPSSVPALHFYLESDPNKDGSLNYFASVKSGDENGIRIDESLLDNPYFDFIGLSEDGHLVFEQKSTGGQKRKKKRKKIGYSREKFIKKLNNGDIKRPIGNDEWSDVRLMKGKWSGAYDAEIPFASPYADDDGNRKFRYGFYGGAIVSNPKRGGRNEQETSELNRKALMKWRNTGREQTQVEFQNSAEQAFRSWFDSKPGGATPRDVVMKRIGWKKVENRSEYPEGIKGQITGEVQVYKVKIQFWELEDNNLVSGANQDIRRLAEEYQADTGNDESGSTQNGFGWLVTVTTIITAAMIGFSFYLFAPMRAVRM